MPASMWLKIGTPIVSLKANTSINLKSGVNWIYNERVISNFTHRAKLNFCHAYSRVYKLKN